MLRSLPCRVRSVKIEQGGSQPDNEKACSVKEYRSLVEIHAHLVGE
jgi:hypothetical protein